ncbi:hypothetical protein [Paludisphaera soli]|uniref:hypothetical protein n=1 Tax=Paludisphaera soli TaxID=2712865 RepID=UPI0013EDB78E|nr:hypothetical protein [Paludisphaera soli]
MNAQLLAIRDLAERWGVDERRARAVVIEGGLPQIELTAEGKYVRWPTVRFQASTVEAWEAERERARTIKVATFEARVPAVSPRPIRGRRLGAW